MEKFKFNKGMPSVVYVTIEEQKSYVVIIERYDSGVVEAYKATGKEIIAYLKDKYGYDMMIEDDEISSIAEFLARADSNNGDGDDYIQIFEI